MDKKPLVITIAGGTASGKTTIAEKIRDVISKNRKTVLISLDDWYLCEDEAKKLFRDGKVNWDDPQTLNWDRLERDLKSLVKGETITVDKFNFDINAHDDTYEIEPAEVIIIEGIFALTDDRINAISDIKFFVHADSDTRLVRRIKRDKTMRYENFDEAKFMDWWINGIKPSHDKFIAPTEKVADFVINTTNNLEEDIVNAVSILIGLGEGK